MDNQNLVLKEQLTGINIHQNISTGRQKQYLDYLIDPCFHGVNRLFVLSVQAEAQQKQYDLPTVEINYQTVMMDGKTFFDQPVKNNLRTYDGIRKIATDQGDDDTTSFLPDYNFFQELL